MSNGNGANQTPPPDAWPAPAGQFGQNIPISDFPQGLPLTGSEAVPLVQNNVTVQVPSSFFPQLLNPGILLLPPAQAQNQTLLSGPAPSFTWAPVSFNALPLVATWNGETGDVVMVSADVTGALGFTPYNATNPQGFQTAAQVSATVAAAVPAPSTTAPLMDGTASPGVAIPYSRGDHVHPTDTSRAAVSALANYMPLTGGSFTGSVSFSVSAQFAGPANLVVGGGAPNEVLQTNGAGTLSWVALGGGIPDAPSDGQLYGRENASWVVVPSGGGGGIPDAPADGTLYARENGAWQHIAHTDITDWTATLAPYALTVNVPVASTTTPLMDGTAAIGVGTTWARADHVHPSDSSKIGDAPSNGNVYARQNAAWVVAEFGATIAAAAPATPFAGQFWWDSVGGQLYVWYTDANGSQWVAANNAPGAPVPFADAPSNGTTYGRVNAGWAGVLPLTGGTLTGGLTVANPSTTAPNLALGNTASAWPGIQFNIPGSGAAVQGAWIGSYVGGNERWEIDLGNAVSETGGNAGSNFQINAYSDAGVLLNNALIIRRSDQLATFAGYVSSPGLIGAATNSSAAAGNVGEVISSVVTTAVTLTNGVTVNMTSLSLTPGDWDVQGEVWFTIGTGGATSIFGGINTVSATFPTAVAMGAARAGTNSLTYASGATPTFGLAPCRLSLSATTPCYLIAFANFPSGATTATGKIWARRAR